MVSKNDLKKLFLCIYICVYIYIFNEGEWLLSLKKEKKNKGSKYDSSTLNFNKF